MLTGTIVPEIFQKQNVIVGTILIGMSDRSYQPTLVGLRAFVAIARKRHFGSAAAELGVSQPSLSQALSMLEEGLGVRLVERNTRKVLLTPEGEALLEKATSALDAVDEFTSAASGVRDPFAQTLRLGLIPTVAPYVLPMVLSGLSREFPEMSLRVTHDGLPGTASRRPPRQRA